MICTDEKTKLTKDQEVAGVILQQLGRGPNRLGVMIGARFFVAVENGVAFQFKRSRAYNGVRITLDADDTYTVRLMKFRGTVIKRDVSFSGIYADNLQSLFESETGLYLSL